MKIRFTGNNNGFDLTPETIEEEREIIDFFYGKGKKFKGNADFFMAKTTFVRKENYGGDYSSLEVTVED